MNKTACQASAQAPKVLWLTCVGASYCAVVNSLWAAVDQEVYQPVQVALLWSPKDARVQKSMQKVRTVLDVMMPTFCQKASPKYHCPEFDESDVSSFLNAARQAFQIARDHNLPVVVDITAGRKYMSAYLLGLALQHPELTHSVVYTHLYNEAYFNTLYPLIPKHCHSFSTEVASFFKKTN